MKELVHSTWVSRTELKIAGLDSKCLYLSHWPTRIFIFFKVNTLRGKNKNNKTL